MPEISRKSFLKGVVTGNFDSSARTSKTPIQRKNHEISVKKKRRWAMVVDLRKCVSCQSCVASCHTENQLAIGYFRTTVSDYELVQNEMPQRVALPRLCNHCDKPSCVTVCPVNATFKREDGVVVIDSSTCIGCGACVQNCPYEARYINPLIGTADKCTYCLHRVEDGLLPACVETCVGGARVFGDLNDPRSQVSQLLKEHNVQVLKPYSGNNPQVYYIGLDTSLQGRTDGYYTLYDPALTGKKSHTKIQNREVR